MKRVIAVTLLLALITCAFSGCVDKAQKYTVETSLEGDYLKTTVQGEARGIILVLSDPSKKTIDITQISELAMADGSESVRLCMRPDIYSFSASSGTYTLVIMDESSRNVVYKEELTFRGANVSIVDVVPVVSKSKIGPYCMKADITVKNDGDFPAHTAWMSAFIDGAEGRTFIKEIPAGQTKTFTKEGFMFVKPSYAPFLSPGTYSARFELRAGFAGETVVATYTTTFETPYPIYSG